MHVDDSAALANLLRERVDPDERVGPASKGIAALAEQNDEWTEARRYTGLDLLARARLHLIESETDDTVMPTELTA
ncbi:hypothetical protein [Streptomyces shenzhenensis]|uniref:hypothetical protein n=1 Tax=Streptomyces shenzhenensis TaxID=943815 RepID=UPI003F53E58B